MAAQMEALRAIDVRFIDFTGGEPTLAAAFVQRVSAAAKDHGMSTGMVTAAHWATSSRTAARTAERFRDIDNWDISTDIYHLEFVSLERVRTAFETLSALGKPPRIRIAHAEPISYEDAKLIDEVYAFAGRQIGFQPVGPVGRGESLFVHLPTGESYDPTPCPTTGPLVQSGGMVAPCCAPVSHEEYPHALQLGDANREPLVDLVGRWRTHPLIQTLRVYGWEPVAHWSAEAGFDMRQINSHRICTQCVNMVRSHKILDHAFAKASLLSHKVRLARALIDLFDEHWMDQELRIEARALLRSSDETP